MSIFAELPALIDEVVVQLFVCPLRVKDTEQAGVIFK